MRDWIIQGTDPEEIKLRQVAVAELAQAGEWREQFRLKCEQLAASQSGPSRFVDWCESENWFDGREWVLWLARLTTLTLVVSFLGLMAGLIPMTVFGPGILVLIAINFTASVFYAGSMHDIFNRVSSRTGDINHYVSLFDRVSTFDSRSELLQGIQQRMLKDDNDVRTHIKQLAIFVRLANIRRDGVLFLLYLAFEFLFFWDAHALDLLERWKAKQGAKARGWFEDLAHWESLCALAKFADDHPDWSYPTVEISADPGRAVFTAEQMAHPLLDDGRVANDVTVGPPGTVMLVTGSNMSGKKHTAAEHWSQCGVGPARYGGLRQIAAHAAPAHRNQHANCGFTG